MKVSAKPSVASVNHLQSMYNELQALDRVLSGVFADGEVHFGGDYGNKSKVCTRIYMQGSQGFVILMQGARRELDEAIKRVEHEFNILGIEPNPYVSEER